MGQRIEPSVFSFERVLAAFLVLASPGCFVLVSEVDIADCDRGSGACSATQRKVYGEKRAEFSVADLTGAELAPLPAVGSRQGRKPGMRVVFLTRTGAVPFMGYSTDIAKGEMREQVETVTRFVATPTERTLHLRRDNRLSSLVLAAVPLSMGVLLLYLSARFREFLSGKDPRGRVRSR